MHKNYMWVHSLLQHSNLIREISLWIKIVPIDKLIKHHGGILAYKVNSLQYLLGNFLTDGHEGISN